MQLLVCYIKIIIRFCRFRVGAFYATKRTMWILSVCETRSFFCLSNYKSVFAKLLFHVMIIYYIDKVGFFVMTVTRIALYFHLCVRKFLNNVKTGFFYFSSLVVDFPTIPCTLMLHKVKEPQCARQVAQ